MHLKSSMLRNTAAPYYDYISLLRNTAVPHCPSQVFINLGWSWAWIFSAPLHADEHCSLTYLSACVEALQCIQLQKLNSVLLWSFETKCRCVIGVSLLASFLFLLSISLFRSLHFFSSLPSSFLFLFSFSFPVLLFSSCSPRFNI